MEAGHGPPDRSIAIRIKPRRMDQRKTDLMKILLITLGSAGDVHPFVGLGLELQQRGHAVQLATNAHFQPLIEKVGLGFVELGTERQYQELTAKPDLWHPIRGLKTVFNGAILPMIRPAYDLIARGQAQQPLAVVSHGIAFGARLAEEKLGVRNITVHLAPLVFRSVYLPPVYQGMPSMGWMPRWMRRKLFQLSDLLVIERVMAGPLNAQRKALKLPPVHSVQEWWNSPRRTIGMFPDWFAPVQPDWPPQLRVAGFPLYDERDIHALPEELEYFLSRGTPPILFTAGSAMRHAGEFFDQSIQACLKMGRRGLLATGHPEQLPRKLPPQVKVVEYAPFSLLLPRCQAFVHHGGIGTSAQGLAAGLPMLVVPLSHDQFDNAARLERLGISRTLNRRHYCARRVCRVLDELLASPAIARQGRSIAARFVGSRPLQQAADLIEAEIVGDPSADQLETPTPRA